MPWTPSLTSACRLRRILCVLMRRSTLLALALCVNALGGVWATLDAQRAGSFMGSSEDPAIRYSTAPLNNPVVDVNRKLQREPSSSRTKAAADS